MEEEAKRYVIEHLTLRNLITPLSKELNSTSVNCTPSRAKKANDE
jgi:hypothetical protein